MAGKIIQRPELEGGATVGGVEVIDASGNIVANIADALASGKIYVGSSAGVSAEVAVTGDVALANTGATTVTGASGTFTGAGLITASAGLSSSATQRTPAADNGPNTFINAGFTAVDVLAVANDANDWINLPQLSSVPVGHTIRIACNAGTNFELRTPATSNEKINNVDSDETAEYLCTDTDTVVIWKLSNTDGWVAQSITNLGAVRTAVIPD